MIKVILMLLMILFINCGDKKSFSIEPLDFSLNKLILGIAFPPNADTMQREFSIKHMNILNINWVRIDENWQYREPENNVFYWEPLSDKLKSFKSANKNVLITLDMKKLPQWWFDLPTDTDRVEEFKEYCDTLLEQFSSDISMIQFGNEWNWEVDKYLNHNDQLYVDMANALYDAVNILPEGNRPAVVLGSLSIDALRFISYSAGSISKVSFEKGVIEIKYTDEEREINLNRLKNIISNIQYNIVDLHLYDDYQNWDIYIADYKTLIGDCGKKLNDLEFIASEFGGPHLDYEPTDEAFARDQLLKYLQALDMIDISKAFYFKMVQEVGTDIAHPNSYLLDSNLKPNSRYEVLRNLQIH